MNTDNYYFSYINLDFRTDRDIRMQKELNRVGIEAVRQRACIPSDYKGDKANIKVMMDRTPGAVGCWLSMVEVIKKAQSFNRHAVIFEDDLHFCDDIQERLAYIEFWQGGKNWDIIFLGGTIHKEPTWHKTINGVHVNPEITGKCNCTLNRDWDRTTDERMIRSYGAFSTHAWIVNYYSIPKLLKLLEENMHKSIGIDHCLIMLQPKLNCFMHIPGCIKQVDGQSNIGSGITRFSNFATLGSHWFQNLISDYDNSLMK